MRTSAAYPGVERQVASLIEEATLVGGLLHEGTSYLLGVILRAASLGTSVPPHRIFGRMSALSGWDDDSHLPCARMCRTSSKDCFGREALGLSAAWLALG
jgi:hypothetical protein